MLDLESGIRGRPRRLSAMTVQRIERVLLTVRVHVDLLRTSSCLCR